MTRRAQLFAMVAACAAVLAACGGESHHRTTKPAATHRATTPAGATAASLGEEHHREPQPFDQREEPVLLPMVHLALGPSQDGVVIGQHGAPGLAVVEALAVDPADAGDEAVGGGAVDQVVEIPAIFFLGIWFLMQFLSGVGSIATNVSPLGSSAPGESQ